MLHLLITGLDVKLCKTLYTLTFLPKIRVWLFVCIQPIYFVVQQKLNNIVKHLYSSNNNKKEPSPVPWLLTLSSPWI